MAFRYRLYPNPEQLAGCDRHCGDARFVWNLALEQANWWRPGRAASPGKTERDRQLAEARKDSWLGEGSSSVQQQALRAADRRRDWTEKTSTGLVVGHDLVVFEQLSVERMLRSARGSVERPGRNVRAKKGLNRRIATSAWSTLVRRTTEKAAAVHGCRVVLVDARYTSQRCSVCAHTAPGNRTTQAAFRCKACGHTEHADVNAAKNILAAGLAATARGGRPEVGVPGEARTIPLEAA